MERTYARKHNNTAASFKQRLFAFIDRHADAFEALARNSAATGNRQGATEQITWLAA